VNAVEPTTRNEQALRAELHAQLVREREKLGALVRDLRAVDAELEGMAGERKQHQLLQTICGALDELGALGAAAAFWGERMHAVQADEHVRLVRGRIDAFAKRIAEIEERRQSVADEVDRQQEAAELLEDDVDELDQREEQRKLEWVIERDVPAFPSSALVLPWIRGGEDDLRFRKALAATALLSLLLALVLPRIELPLPDLAPGPIDVPARLARLIVEPQRLPPPPPPQELAPVPAEELAKTQPAEAPKPKEGPGKGAGEGPSVGPGKGILAFREKLAVTQNQALSRLGSQARISSPGTAPSLVQRSMVTSLAPGSSGGINLADLSRGVSGSGGGGGGQQGIQIARATSTIAGGSGGGSERGVGRGGPPIGRTDEEIQIVFDRYKSALYRLYNRELRNDPTLKGQMVLRIRIEPDGSVTLCELQGTDMKAPQLVAQVLERVRTFDFGAKEVPTITILYPIDFLPAT
jgi:hypothetical protein